MADHHHHASSAALTFYPAFCHKVSPTFFAWVKMAAIDVHRLKFRAGFEGQNLYFYLNHPIQFICIAGIIVARDEHERRSIIVVDDSSGACLEVVCSKTPATPANTTTTNASTHQTSTTRKPLNIIPLIPGARAKLKGTITVFRGMFQLHLERYEMLADTNAEVRFWDERTRMRVEVLGVPWVLAEGEVERLRREAEKGGKGSGKGGDANGEGYVVAKRKKAERERERERRGVQREERDRLRIVRRYEREEVVREKLAQKCREKSKVVGKRRGRDRRDRGGRVGGTAERRRDPGENQVVRERNNE
ncbi:hypothetical protein AJ79_05921 [Helicocarpus griseus UAMH5409]|uniref:CST complex subunit Stn1 N-terminal domain-containing protein n=1 Tax=Helicocarpus griseus UAMH5409 TaxID=1447875 RepID=A0A2B7XIH5_9EURO|nr:hypothetical protein AJ79_05921 [Helicocarpus griseus UAMH5409]